MLVLLPPAVCIAASGTGVDPTGFGPLDTAALQAKHPAGVYLIAISRAGTRLVAAGEHGVIIYSDNAGETWTQATVPVDVTLTCIAFRNDRAGWAAGHFGVILHTNDGGGTWHLQMNGLQVNQLTLQAAQAAAALNFQSPAMARAARRADFFVKSGPSKPFLSILILSDQKIFVFGAYRMAMLTMDGGKTWVDWSLHIFDALSHDIYDAGIVGKDIYLVGEMGLIFCSHDGGNEFLPSVSPAQSTLFGVRGTASGAVLVFGVAGCCYRTTDACKTWSQITIPASESLTSCVALHSGAILLGNQAGALFKSVDEGASFTELHGGHLRSIADMDVAPNGDLVAVAAAGIASVSAADLG